MNCDECKERVFELIEREAVDPEGVRETLAGCPDCRAAFDDMKAALALAELLPIEEPPASLDAAVLRAAVARAPKMIPSRKWRLQAPPWAVAAIALLAVGVGVWAIPRGVQLESEAAPTEMKGPEEAVLAEQMLDETRPARIAAAPASRPAADMAAGAVAEPRSGEADTKASLARKQERDDDAATTCKRKVDEIERRKRADKDYVPKPEEELAIGKCYQTLDKAAEARKWLQRAAAHRETKARAEEALRDLAPE